MGTIQIDLPDRRRLELDSPCQARQVLTDAGLAEEAIAVWIEGRPVGLDHWIDQDCTLEPIARNSRTGLTIARRTAAAVLTLASHRLFPDAERVAVHLTEDGFHVDLDLDRPLRQDDLSILEAEMNSIREENHPIEERSMARTQAQQELRHQRGRFRLELLAETHADPVPFVQIGEFLEIGEGPYLGSTGQVGPFRLLSLSGAYWKDCETAPVLQRVHGTCFLDEEGLRAHLARRERAAERDHRRLGRQLDLFTFQEEAPTAPFWHPRGVRLLETIQADLKKRLTATGYEEIRTPTLLPEAIWRLSGHWDHYHRNMFRSEDRGRSLAVKPMNCPGAIIFYRSRRRSFRELPLRLSEFGLVHRNERSGVLSGLLRAQAFTQDDAHIFCSEADLESEVRTTLDLIQTVHRDFGFPPPLVELSTRPVRSIGEEGEWNRAEATLRRALDNLSIEYETHTGEGTFYGPKIDFHLPDCMGRLWQTATVQVDFSMARRFELTYVGPDGRHRHPAIVHRAILGSLERSVALLLEHHGGSLPIWLCPEQVRILPVDPGSHLGLAHSIRESLEAAERRATIDGRDETVGYRVRAAARERVPYIVLAGDREAEQGKIALRRRDGVEIGSLPLDRFLTLLGEEVDRRVLEPSISSDD